MKQIASASTVLTLALALFLGCASPQDRAQKLYNAGRYEEVVAKYENEPSAAPVVQQARDKIAERWYAEKRYQEVVDNYPDSKIALRARLELTKSDTLTADRGAIEQPKQGAVYANKEAAATAEYQRIMEVEAKDLRMKALREFVKNPQYDATSAHDLAHEELNKK